MTERNEPGKRIFKKEHHRHQGSACVLGLYYLISGSELLTIWGFEISWVLIMVCVGIIWVSWSFQCNLLQKGPHSGEVWAGLCRYNSGILVRTIFRCLISSFPLFTGNLFGYIYYNFTPECLSGVLFSPSSATNQTVIVYSLIIFV